MTSTQEEDELSALIDLLLKPLKETFRMSKKKDDASDKNDDIQMYSGHIRMFGGPGYTEALEDMAIERFPATSQANARAFLIQAGRTWLDENGLPQSGGIQIMYCGLDGEKRANSTALAAVTKPTVTGTQQPAAVSPVAKTYRAFKCPIVSLCNTKFVGSYDHFSDTLLIEKEK